MFKQQTYVHLGAAAAITLCLALPAAVAVVLGSVWRSVGSSFGAADPFSLIIGALPTALYMVAPIACVLTVCRAFHNNSLNFALPVMFASGISIWRCAAPGLILGALFTFGACILAWVVAPLGVTLVENAKFDLKRNINLGALRARQFHTLRRGDLTVSLSFKRNLGEGRIYGVIVALRNEAADRSIIVSEFAHFKKTKRSLILKMVNGNRVNHGKAGDNSPVYFREFAVVLPLKAGRDGYFRKYVTKQEMSYSELMSHAGFRNPHQDSAGIARSELAKRFLVPLLSVSHVLLALGLLYVVGPIRLRRRRADLWIVLGLVSAHAVAVAVIEILTRHSIAAMAILALLILLEGLTGGWLLFRAANTLRNLELPATLRRWVSLRRLLRMAQ